MVETLGLELVTHHPVIKPVSAHSRERNFKPQDRPENDTFC